MADAVKEVEKPNEEIDLESASEEEGSPDNIKSGGLKKLIIMLVVTQVVMASSAFSFVKFYLAPKIQYAYENPVEEGPKIRERGDIHLIEGILVNPAGTNGTRFLSTSIGIETPKAGGEGGHGEVGGSGGFEAISPVIRDILIAILSSRTMEELSSVEGKALLREEILTKLNQAVKPDSIYSVYFVDYVLQ